jgi:hypothetical protein
MFASPTVFRNRFPGDVPLPLPPLPPGEIKKPGRRLSDAFQPVPRQGLRALYGLVRRRPAAAPGPRIVGRIRCTTEVLRGVREAGCPVAHGRFRVMPPRPAGGAGDALKVPSCRPLPTCVRAGGGRSGALPVAGQVSRKISTYAPMVFSRSARGEGLSLLPSPSPSPSPSRPRHGRSRLPPRTPRSGIVHRAGSAGVRGRSYGGVVPEPYCTFVGETANRADGGPPDQGGPRCPWERSRPTGLAGERHAGAMSIGR